jgi:transcriptional regulator with XRE-family HTH domain
VSEPDENPAAVRLGEELRQLRIAAGYPTIQALAARIDGYGDSMLAKVEQGRRTASRQLFPAWLDACAVHIETKAPVLTSGHRRALTALWELALKREGPIPEFIELWLKREAAAAFLRLWALNVLPGLLQTYEYAHAMFALSGVDEDAAAEKATARIQRQSILDGPDATHVTAIIYEPVLYSIVGTAEVMARQLTRILEMSRRPNLVIQVVRDTGYFPGRRGQFEIASGPKVTDTMVLWGVEDQTMDDPVQVGKAAALFERIRGYALTIEESRALIQEALERWKSRQQ